MNDPKDDDVVSLDNISESDGSKTVDAETVPLKQSNTAASKLPSREASSAEVRDWLAENLRKRGIPSDRVDSIVAKWTIGTGSDLRYYPAEMYRSIFGPGEDGWAVYGVVKTAVITEEDEEDLSPGGKGVLVLRKRRIDTDLTL
jgi:hypothetical protein